METPLHTSLRSLRTFRRWSLGELSARSGVHKSTLSRWESGRFQPRLNELEAVLNALEVAPAQRDAFFSLIHAPRGVRHLKSGTARFSGMEDAHLPSGGDLFRAMRLRAGVNSKDAARILKVHPSTLSRWEKSELVPGEEDRERLFTFYNAQPEEREILRSRALLTADEPDALTTRDQLTQRLHLLTGFSWHTPHRLLDLNFLSLEAACWSYMKRDEWARYFLAVIYVWHGIGLYWRHRFGEARDTGLRALALSAGHPPDRAWLWAAAYTARSSAALSGGSSARREVRFLEGYLPMARHLGVAHRIIDPLSDPEMASGSGEEALRLARQSQSYLSQAGADYWTHRTNNWQIAKACLMAGEWDSALSVMPVDEQPNLHQRIEEKLTWAELLLATGERSLAEQRLLEARSLMREMGIGFSLADRLGEQL
jgi:transcriptional regulator with XRE-family HTH domain